MARRVTKAEIRKAAKQAGIPFPLFYAVVGQESGGRSGAVSPAGARGAAQLMPGTARALEQRYGINTSTAYGNLLGGAYYLKEQLDRFGQWNLALAAYNAGPGAVKKYGGVPPYEETQNYVRNILAKAGVKGNARGGTQPGNVPPSAPLPPGGGVAGPPAPAAPSPLEAIASQGLRDIAEGDYSPQRQLQSLLDAREAVQPAQASQGTPTTPAGPPAPLQGVSGGAGVTWSGQKSTHPTSGLAGYPAVDIFGEPGTPFLAPEDGKIIRHSGRGGTTGQVYGYSLYYQGKSGRRYFITHLGSRASKGSYKAGQPIGTISAWDAGSPHAHVGVREPRRGR